jgi:hypothetical protein
MLELIGFIAVVYLAIKFLPDILSFALKVIVVLVAIWLLLAVLGWMFTLTPFIVIL